jgi:hypothetical protein
MTGLSGPQPHVAGRQDFGDFVEPFGSSHLIWVEGVHRMRLVMTHKYLARPKRTAKSKQ